MKPTLIYTAALLFLALSASADIIDESELYRFPPRCRSTLMIEIQGFGHDVLATEARRECAASCEDRTDSFKDKRCPALCGRRNSKFRVQFARPEVCNLCSSGADIEISRCRGAVDSLVRRCKRGCRRNAVDRRNGFARVSSTSGGMRLRFPSRITS